MKFNMTPIIDIVFLLIIFLIVVCQGIDAENFDVAVPAINGIIQGFTQVLTTTGRTQEEGWRDTLSIFGGFD